MKSTLKIITLLVLTRISRTDVCSVGCVLCWEDKCLICDEINKYYLWPTAECKFRELDIIGCSKYEIIEATTNSYKCTKCFGTKYLVNVSGETSCKTPTTIPENCIDVVGENICGECIDEYKVNS